MPDRIVIDDGALAVVETRLRAVAGAISPMRHRRPPADLPSLTGIGADIEAFVSALGDGCAAVGDAASSAATTASLIAVASDAVDADLATAFSGSGRSPELDRHGDAHPVAAGAAP